MSVKFSIVIPIFNVSPYLRSCLDSLLGQLCGDYEAICIDDGSTDGSGQIVDEYARRDPRFKVIHQLNAGEGAARNAALDIAKGEWIAFLDADDVWAPWLLKHCEMAISQCPETDVVAFKCIEFRNDCDLKWKDEPDFNIESKIDARQYLDVATASGNFWSRCYRSTLVKEVRFGKTKIGEDLLWLFEVMLNVNAIVKIESEAYGYRLREGSATLSKATAEKARSVIQCDSRRLSLVAQSRKIAPPAFMRLMTNGLTESFMALYRQLSRQERQGLWEEWISALRIAKGNDRINLFNWVRMSVICALPFYPTAWLLCCLPNIIKRCGIHR